MLHASLDLRGRHALVDLDEEQRQATGLTLVALERGEREHHRRVAEGVAGVEHPDDLLVAARDVDGVAGSDAEVLGETDPHHDLIGAVSGERTAVRDADAEGR